MARVVSCRYLRMSCSEDDHPLFRRYYARSNRERGVKLLRCFPHCCPEHVQRCYCGSSVHALVTFAAEASVSNQRNLVVCARFEPSRVVPLWPLNLAIESGTAGLDDTVHDNERKLQPGEIISLPASLLSSSKHQAEQTIWIRADREGEIKQRNLPKNVSLYVLNNHRYPKWFYSYDSSITRTQREMTHHLALYVFQVTGTSSQPGGVDALVLARHQSPGFQLISYRRSGNNSSDAGCNLPAHNPEDSQFTAIDVNSSRVILPPTADEMDVDSFGVPTDDFESEAKFEATQENAAVFYPPQRTSSLDLQAASKSAISDAAFWQFDSRARQSGLTEKAKHLLILWRFLSCVSLSDAGITADTLDVQIRSHWLRVAGALLSPRDRTNSQLEGVMSSFLLSICKISPSFTTEQSLPRDQIVVQAATNLLLRALSSRAVQYVLQSAFAVEGDVIDKPHLRERLITLVLDLYDVLGDLFQLGSPGGSAVFSGSRFTLPTLVDEVLSLIYSQKRFSALRPEVSALLMGRQTYNSQTETMNLLFRAFTAQTRELIITTGGGPLGTGARSLQWIGDVNKQSPWSRRWLLEPGSIQVNSIIQDQKSPEEPSLTQLCRWLHEFACIDIALRADESQLSIRSVVPLVDGTAPMDLVTDGHLRIFRVAPSGVSSMVSACVNWSIGDYTARFNRSELLEIDFYAFQEGSSTTDRSKGGRMSGVSKCNSSNGDTIHVRRLRIRLVLEQHIDAGDLSTTVDPRDIFIIFHGVVADALYTTTENRFGNQYDTQLKPSEMLTSDRSMLLRDLQWSSQVEIHGGYVAAPATCC